MPRTVVFDVGGVIDLASRIDVKGDVTVAGQTAPGEGITITGSRLRVVENDVIIRGLKIRPGDGDGEEPVNRDCISVGKDGTIVEHVIIDSNSFSWAMDETAAIWAGASNITYSNNIIAEGLDRTSIEGLNSFGLLIGGGSQRVTVSGNLFASNEHRNPQLLGAKQVEFVNNVVYNYGDNGFEALSGSTSSNTAHIIGNVFIAGPDTAHNNPVRLRGTSPDSAYYLKDNLGSSRTSDSDPESAIAEGTGLANVKSAPVFAGSGVSAISSHLTLDDVLKNVGARTGGGLDATDERILKTVVDNTGKIIVTPSDVDTHTPPSVRTTLADTDKDGIPDVFEPLVGADAKVYDANGDADGDGYTNIEEYINGLIDGFDTPTPTPTNPGGTDTGGPAPAIRVQAEDLDLVQGFQIQRNKAADGGLLIGSGSNDEQRASLVWDGPDGVYDLSIEHFDENDGESVLAVEVNGVAVDSFVWDKQLGDKFASAKSLTSHISTDLHLEAGDVVTLAGRKDAAELLRIDALEFNQTGDLPGGGTAPQPTGAWRIEAEAADTMINMRVDTNAAASNGQVARAFADGQSELGFAFGGGGGTYDIAVEYFDENDGVSTAELYVGDRKVGGWAWDQDLNDSWASAATRTSFVFDSVSVKAGETVRLVGAGAGEEPFRVDAFEFRPASPSQPDPSIFVEAEDMILRNGFKVETNTGASNGMLIRAGDAGSQRAELAFSGHDGRYDLRVDYFDENDGVSHLAVEVNGMMKDDWIWSSIEGGAFANTASRTSHVTQGLDLKTGDIVALVGVSDGGEPLRIDCVEFLGVVEF